ncbi:MAG: hypothetical protein PHD03_04830 [Bacilli bacterium]|nr:hypothetical protein [Bacilli bacterium]
MNAGLSVPFYNEYSSSQIVNYYKCHNLISKYIRGYSSKIGKDYICNKPTDLEHSISMGDILNMKEIEKKFNVLKDDNCSKEIRFKNPVIFKIELENDIYYYFNNIYKIYSYGQTQEEAESKLYQCFLKKYKLFSSTPDEELDEKARELKNNLKMIFED